jgi:hypothetical protein
MNVKKLKKLLEICSDDMELCISAKTYPEGTMGASDVAFVKSAFKGFDWDSNRLILFPDVDLRAVEFREYNKMTQKDLDDNLERVRTKHKGKTVKE